MPLTVYVDVQGSSVTCIQHIIISGFATNAIMNGGFATNTMSALYDHAKHYDEERTSRVK